MGPKKTTPGSATSDLRAFPDAGGSRRGGLSETTALGALLASILALLVWHGWWTRSPPRPLPVKRNPAQSPAYQVDLNQAAVLELLHLPGVGPQLAQRIIDNRQRHGPYTSLEDLARVKGVGKKLIERLRPYAKASAPAPPAEEPP